MESAPSCYYSYNEPSSCGIRAWTPPSKKRYESTCLLVSEYHLKPQEKNKSACQREWLLLSKITACTWRFLVSWPHDKATNRKSSHDNCWKKDALRIARTEWNKLECGCFDLRTLNSKCGRMFSLQFWNVLRFSLRKITKDNQFYQAKVLWCCLPLP